MSARHASDIESYDVSRLRFLSEHPYCQVWLHEHGIGEELAIRNKGNVRLGERNSPVVPVPLATEVHHKNKRRSEMLLDTRYWMAVSAEAHKRIETHKDWARAAGYLLDF
jgi:hypothetical protein